MEIQIDNIKINYIKQGKGQPLVFLHGIFLDTAAYKGLIKILSKYFKVYAFDFPMHGKSGTIKEKISVDYYTRITEKFVKKLKIKNPIIFGFSAGGLIALLYASRNKVKELILGDSAGAKYTKSIFPILLRLIFIMVPVGFLQNPIGLLKISFNGCYNFFRNIFTKNFFILSNEVLRRDFSKEMKKIKCPATILWTRHDEVTPFKYHKVFLNNIKNSKLIEMKGNHMWLALRPKEIMKYIK